MITTFVYAGAPVHLIVRYVGQKVLTPSRIDQIFKKWFDDCVDDDNASDWNLLCD